MTQKNKDRPFERPVLVAPDRASMLFVNRALSRAGVKPSLAVAKKRGYATQALKILDKKNPLLLLIPSTKLDNEQLMLARNVSEAGGVTLAWGSGAVALDSSVSDQWLLERLLEQHGAVITPHLEALAEAARILTFFKALPSRTIAVKGRTNDLITRLNQTLQNRGIKTGKSKKGRWAVNISTGGKAYLGLGEKRRLVLRDLCASTQGLALLLRAGQSEQIADPLIDPSPDEIGAIARPPARLLSETTSKRLAVTFGIMPPLEHLCKSATEAARFASSIDGPVVAKLVRPELANKTSVGAVKTAVKGPSAVRRAFHELEGIASSLGPPKALGVLVAKQIDGGVRIRLKMTHHPRFGRIILIGNDADSRGEPLAALTCLTTATQAHEALVDGGIVPPGKSSIKLAQTIARFAILVHQLEKSVSRAEIDPLVAIDDEQEALALDLLLAIG